MHVLRVCAGCCLLHGLAPSYRARAHVRCASQNSHRCHHRSPTDAAAHASSAAALPLCARRSAGKLIISSVTVCGGIYLMIDQIKYIRIALGVYYMLASLCAAGVLLGFEALRVVYHIHDLLLGHMLFLVLFIFAALQFPKDVQTWLLFHNALSQGVVIDDILKYARKSQEQSAGADDVLDDTAELKKLIHHQVRCGRRCVRSAVLGYAVATLNDNLES
jgi:hypothetical protein